MAQDSLPTMKELNPLLAPYQKSDVRRSVWQLVTTLVPYFLMWVAMVLSIQVSYWLTLALAIPTAGLLIRVFIFFHDAGHNSFFPTTKANRRLGFWLGVLVFTPSEHWWKSHAIHHATSGNLDKRGTGDVATLTMEEYHESHFLKKLGYRFFRNPLVMFGLGPLYMFLIMHRFPTPRYGKRETMNVVYTNLALLAIAVGMSLLIGWQNYLLIQLPVIYLAGVGGIWMFYLQHQFEDSYWERGGEWDYVASALLGASYYQLPKVLQWFTGNIGFHHIHHLSPRIPNYNLPPAHENIPQIKRWARVITLKESIDTVRWKLYREDKKKMITFKDVTEAEAAMPVKTETAGD